MTRATIIEAAVACAEESGWDATTMQGVRERAGVSNGSLFHHFPTRPALQAGVLASGLAGHQDALLAALAGAGSAEAGVAGVVTAHCRWSQERPALAHLFLSTPPETLRDAADPGTVDANRAFFTRVARWLGDHGWTGDPPLPVVVALWMGPAHEYTRRRLADPTLPDAADTLGAGAWRALAPILGGAA